MVSKQQGNGQLCRRKSAPVPVDQENDENESSTSVVQNLNKVHLDTNKRKSQSKTPLRESGTLRSKVVKPKTNEAKAKKRQQLLERLAEEEKGKLTREAILSWLNKSDPNPEPVVEMELSQNDATGKEPKEMVTENPHEKPVDSDKEEYDEELCRFSIYLLCYLKENS